MVDYTVKSYQILGQKIWGGFTETVSFKMFVAVCVFSHCVSFKTSKIAKKNDVRNQLAQS